ALGEARIELLAVFSGGARVDRFERRYLPSGQAIRLVSMGAAELGGIKGALARVLDQAVDYPISGVTALQHGSIQQRDLVRRNIVIWRSGHMFRVPVKPGDIIAERGVSGHNAIEVGRVLLRFQQTFPPAG